VEKIVCDGLFEKLYKIHRRMGGGHRENILNQKKQNGEKNFIIN